MTTPSLLLGPARTGTLCCVDLDQVLAAYVDYLSMQVAERGALSEALANLWGAPALVGARYAVLSSPSGIAWLRVVEDRQLAAVEPFRQNGWLSLEVVVADVDQLAEELKDSPFEIFRAPANLDVSADIRAMQVIGPAGEVLYLTQIDAAVPPFELPQASCRVDHLFIPVLSCQTRATALAFYQQFAPGREFVFDTRITSVNAAFGWPLERRHPVATVQLAGNTMIEIDEIPAAAPRPCSAGRLPAGIAMVSFEMEQLPSSMPGFSEAQCLEEAPYYGRRALCGRGAAGEWVELIERAPC